MVSVSANNQTFRIFTFQTSTNICDLRDDTHKVGVVESLHTEPNWEALTYLWAVVLCLFVMAFRKTRSPDGAPSTTIEIILFLLAGLSAVHVWKVGCSAQSLTTSTEGLICLSSILTLLTAAAFLFGRNRRKWIGSAAVLMLYLGVMACSVSVLNIHQETYETADSRLIVPLIILSLVLGCMFLSIFRNIYVKILSNGNRAIPLKKNIHPEDEASLLSKLFLDWVFRVAWVGYKDKLRETDVPELNIRDQCDTSCPPFEQAWRQEQLIKCTRPPLELRTDSDNRDSQSKTDDTDQNHSGSKKSHRANLLFALIRAYGLKYFFLQFLNCALKLTDFIYPLAIESLMKYVQNRSSEPQWRGYGLIAASCFASFLSDSLHLRVWMSLRRLSYQVKMAVTVAVYKKALTLSNDCRKEKTAGQLVSLISEDLDKVTSAMEEIYLIFLTPIQTLVAMYLLYTQLGGVAVLTLPILLCLIPINYWLGQKVEDLEEKRNEIKDGRIKVMNEILNGIKVLKLYAWEKSFIGKICGIRNEEMAVNKKIRLCYSGLDFMFKAILFLVRFISLFSVVMMGDSLDAPKAFLTMTLLLLLSYPFSEVAVVIPSCVQARVSLSRINDFLTEKDIAKEVVMVDSDSESAISIREGTFTWEPSQQPTLRNINLEIPKGGLIAVVGMVGSGKSSLLSAILGEMEKLDGNVVLQSSTAYVSQEAWIQNASLQDNILFGSKFEADRYQKVIKACALKDDFKMLAAGDKTEIGEKGINLSGGQKQRVSLARAVYSDADIYLLDDPLSAVDAHVGKHIFNQVIGHSGMLKSKTRILVTHGVHWLPFVDNIVVLKDGVISECGTYRQLVSHNGAFAQFLKDVFSHDKDENDIEVEQIKKNIFTRLISLDDGDHSVEKCLPDEKVNLTVDSDSTAGSIRVDSSDDDNSNNDDKVVKLSDAKGKIIDEEGTEFGSVSLAVYKEYLLTIGPRWVVFFTLMYGLMMVARDFNAVWLGKWTEDPLLANKSLVDTTDYNSALWVYVFVYAFLGIMEIVTAFLFCFTINMRALSAATFLHTKLLTKILHYPMAFFDTTPTGRIINRFSKDVDSVDELGRALDGYIECAGEVLANLAMMVYISPKLIPFIFIVGGIYIFLQKLYVPSARQLRRYKSKFASPVFVHFKETLDGTHTLRAFKAQGRFISKMKKSIEEHVKFDLMQLCLRTWFGMKISTLSQCVSLAAGLIVMWDDSISPAHAGLLLSFSAWFVESLSWYVQHASYTEQELVSLERVIEYSNKPEEAAWEIPEQTPANEWPQNGEIVVDNYQARYRDGLDLVLRGVTCNIRSGEKVGIVGRTGAGKTSLTVALFRLVEAAAGRINIDEHQISTMGLHDLRKNITILPQVMAVSDSGSLYLPLSSFTNMLVSKFQDPVIFGGSLHMNLDPFSEKSTDELWEALQHSHLYTFVQGLPGKLDYECGEAGKNLSVGQRQLVCLARTLLRKTKVLVLDEATAAVDLETDDLIQKTICKEFKHCTVLTIAHRLNTVMDYDRILVMEKGLVKEFDSPKNLLADCKSTFYGMAKDANLI